MRDGGNSIISTNFPWKEAVIYDPDGRPKECIAETGLSKNTVYKWWDNPPTVRYEDGGLTVKIRPSSDTGGFAKGAVNATERPLRRFWAW